MMAWESTTEGGFAVRVYTEDGGGERPIHGSVWVENENRWCSISQCNCLK